MARLDQLDEQPIDLDGLRRGWGIPDCRTSAPTSVRSTSKGPRIAAAAMQAPSRSRRMPPPLTHALAHQCAGVEPSGRPFNALVLPPDQRNFNPCMNAGAKEWPQARGWLEPIGSRAPWMRFLNLRLKPKAAAAPNSGRGPGAADAAAGV
jgi:hypothetical protein